MLNLAEIQTLFQLHRTNLTDIQSAIMHLQQELAETKTLYGMLQQRVILLERNWE